MLYIIFKINEKEKFKDFLVVYNYMLDVRRLEYKEKEDDFKIDWATATEEEMNAFWDEDRPKITIFDTLFTTYASQFLLRFFDSENATSAFINENKVSFINYLQAGFEVCFDGLEELKDNKFMIKFSTGNYPFGGLDRFLITLKAFDLLPIECFNGFDVVQIIWTSEFKYEANVLSEKTKMYLLK